jgi:peptide/nickel transport system ATP-binding protein
VSTIQSPAVHSPAVEIRNLSVAYQTPAGLLPAISDVSLRLEPGTITGLVGESGSGKSTLAMSMLNGVQPPGRITAGSIEIEGLGDVLGMGAEEIRAVRAAKVGYVFQAAQNSMNPLKKIGKQVLDLGRSHEVTDLPALLRNVRELLGQMGLDAPRVLDSYQHELSGGMRQRVGITFALALNAHVLVLDEPTTALDMISQANILEIITQIHEARGLTTLMVTHDIGVVASVADRIAVMYGGRVVETGPTQEILRNPAHPYTRALIRAIPRLTGDITAAQPLAGRPPTLMTLAKTGCVFRDRCAVYSELKLDRCEGEDPTLAPVTALVGSDDRLVACHAVDHGDSVAAGRPTPIELTATRKDVHA